MHYTSKKGGGAYRPQQRAAFDGAQARSRRQGRDAGGHDRRRCPVREQVRPILNAIGTNICHVGSAGAGNTIKAIHNTMSTVNTCAMMERFAVGLKAGFDLKTMADIVMASSGSGNSNALARVDRALIPRHFELGFKVALMNKDLDTFQAMAKELHVPVSVSNMAQH